MFAQFQIDLKGRTVNLIGPSNSVQHYVDDGKGPPPNPQGGAMLNPGAGQPTPVGVANPFIFPPNGILPPNGPLPPNFRINPRLVERNVQIIPIPDLPVELPPDAKR
jgi:hypothetical protein